MPNDALPRGAAELGRAFGGIDIYLFDQLLRGRITPDMRVLDAGCGSGRNLHYLMRCGADVYGVDADPERVQAAIALAAAQAPRLQGPPDERFLHARISELPFPDCYFDAVICSAVLHFSADEEEFTAMVDEMWRVLAGGGVFFARLASTIGVERYVRPIQERWHELPDGTQRFLVDEAYLLGVGERIGARLLDPIKTTNVQNLRAMTTWVLGKP